MLWQIQADGTSSPEASTSLGPAPRLPSPSPGEGLLAHVQAVSAERSHPALGAGKLLAPSPPPGLGGWLGRGEVSWNGTPGLVHPSPLGATLDLRE